MLIHDSGLRRLAAFAHFGMDIKDTRRLVVDMNRSRHTQHVLFGIRNGFRSSIAQDLQHILGLAHRSTQCDGNRQSRHTRIGNTHRKGILIDIFGEVNRYRIGFAAKEFFGASHTQGYSNRLRTTDSRDNL